MHRAIESQNFCFTEYKKHKEPNGEPEGQCLSAMLAGQAINQKPEQAMYGCFVMGREGSTLRWYFMTLLGKKCCISQDFSATTADIFTVFKTLKALKEIVKELTA